MATESLISWQGPTHLHFEKKPDWYWIVGIITLALAVVAFLFGQIISGIFVIVAATALVLHASTPPKYIKYEINDRGIMANNVLYSFLDLESFCIPHDMIPPRLLIKSRKVFMPLIVIYIEGIDPESIREIMLKYIAETEHREPLLKHILEGFGF
jgi:flagellar motor component MotA